MGTRGVHRTSVASVIADARSGGAHRVAAQHGKAPFWTGNLGPAVADVGRHVVVRCQKKNV
jgi:hypothetical protein